MRQGSKRAVKGRADILSADEHALSPARHRSRIVRISSRSRCDLALRLRRFRDEEPQRLRGILHQAGADRPFAIDEAPDGALVYAEAPRGGGRTAKYLDTVGKMLGKILL